MQEATGIKPAEDVVQKGYATCIKQGRLDDLRSLHEETGIKPAKYVYKAFIESL